MFVKYKKNIIFNAKITFFVFLTSAPRAIVSMTRILFSLVQNNNNVKTTKKN
jgi:hypothetical protein